MPTLPDRPRARDVVVTADCLTVSLQDGRRLSVPLEWFPRLKAATPQQRNTKSHGLEFDLQDLRAGRESISPSNGRGAGGKAGIGERDAVVCWPDCGATVSAVADYPPLRATAAPQ